MTKHYDIAIVGAGPSGCACALALHDSGLRVALIDKEAFPRDKICGDAIPGPAFKAMRHINPDWEQAMRTFADSQKITTSKVYAPNGKSLRLNWVSFSYNSKRQDFDHFLFQLVQQQKSIHPIHQRLQSVSSTPEQIHCHFKDGSSLSCALIIACDGANSMVRRQLDHQRGMEKAGAIAVRRYYRGVGGVEPGVNEFHFFKEHRGYLWIFPLSEGHTNIGFGIARQRGEAVSSLRHSLDDIICNDASIAPRFASAQAMENTKGFALPVWTGKKAISGHRYLLCGDAASLIDPLQGHGIDKAMWSGLLAARQARRSFAARDFSAAALADYDQAVQQKVGRELSRSAAITRAVLRFPWLINAVAAVGQHQELTQWAARKLKI